jgi:hypothetical protein
MPSNAHLVIAKTYSSPLLSGPPMSDALVALVVHMFTADEADIVQHLKPFRAKKASTLARESGRPLYEVGPMLERLARDKYVIFSFGHGGHERFTLLPVVPGTFEAVLMKKSTDEFTEWHRRFAELFEAIFSTGYMADYSVKPVNPVRYIPVGEVIEAIPTALPSDRLEASPPRAASFLWVRHRLPHRLPRPCKYGEFLFAVDDEVDGA